MKSLPKLAYLMVLVFSWYVGTHSLVFASEPYEEVEGDPTPATRLIPEDGFLYLPEGWIDPNIPIVYPSGNVERAVTRQGMCINVCRNMCRCTIF